MLAKRKLFSSSNSKKTKLLAPVREQRFLTPGRPPGGGVSGEKMPVAKKRPLLADKASILDEAIEYLKSLQMQVQIMWMTTGMAPMMFPDSHQFMPPMAVGMNSACMPAAQGLNQMARMPYMNHSLSNHIPMNSSPAMNPMYIANQMQNIQLREASNHFLQPDGGQAMLPQAAGPYAYTPQVAPKNQIPEVPDCTVVPTSAPDGI